MCWNSTVSWSTLALGTALNIGTTAYYFEKPVIAVSIAWQWALFMQMSDGLTWRSLKNRNQDQNTFAADLAFLFNMTQPVIAGLVLLAADLTEKVMVYIAVTILLLFIGYSLLQTRKLSSDTNHIESLDGHLDYHWWRQKPYKSLGIIFLLTLLAMILLLLRPLSFALLEAGYVLITAFLAYTLFGRTSPTQWCFFAAFAPIFTALFFWISKKYPLVDIYQ
jgi:hypothetical protein